MGKTEIVAKWDPEKGFRIEAVRDMPPLVGAQTYVESRIGGFYIPKGMVNDILQMAAHRQDDARPSTLWGVPVDYSKSISTEVGRKLRDEIDKEMEKRADTLLFGRARLSPGPYTYGGADVYPGEARRERPNWITPDEYHEIIGALYDHIREQLADAFSAQEIEALLYQETQGGIFAEARTLGEHGLTVERNDDGEWQGVVR